MRMAMEGTEVTAMIDGETVGMAMVMDGKGNYSVKLDPGDPSDDGDMDFTGMTVMFMVGMEDVEQSGEWMEGMVSPLNLMAMAMEAEPTMEPVMVQGRPGRDGLHQACPEPTELTALTAKTVGKARKARKARPEPTELTAQTAATEPPAETALTATTVLMALTAPLEPRATQATWEPQDLTAQQALAVRQALTAAAESWPSSA